MNPIENILNPNFLFFFVLPWVIGGIIVLIISPYLEEKRKEEEKRLKDYLERVDFVNWEESQHNRLIGHLTGSIIINLKEEDNIYLGRK